MTPRQLAKTGFVTACILLLTLAAGISYTSRNALAQNEQIVAEIMLDADETDAAPVFVFRADDLPPAPEGYHYSLWSMPMESQPMLLAEMDAQGGPSRIAAIDELSFALVEGFQFAFSVDKDGESNPVSPYHVVATTSLANGLPAVLSSLLASGSGVDYGRLANALAQADVAQQHAGFIADSIEEGSIAMARNHAEHVVNTLDGEQGMFFGDLNRDGQAQNPGDGYGVRAYLEDATAVLVDLSVHDSLPEEAATVVDDLMQSLEESQAHLSDAREQALKLYAIDTDGEAVVVHDDLAFALNGLADVISDAIETAYSLVSFPLILDIDTLKPPVEMHEMGEIRMLSEMNEDGAVNYGGYNILMTELPEMLSDAPLELWALEEDAEPLLLGQVAVDEADEPYSEGLDSRLSGIPSRVAISLAGSVANNGVDSSSQTLIVGAVSPQTLAAVTQLLDDDGVNGAGSLQLAAQQTTIAQAHTGFIQDSIDTDNLMMARNHAEHTVNILDGESGMFYGDLNRDGQTQNPGDGNGVRVYLLDALDSLAALKEDAATSDDQLAAIQELEEDIDDALSNVGEAQELAIKLYAIDTSDEASAVHDELAGKLDELLQEILGAADQTLSLAVYKLMADPAAFVVDDELETAVAEETQEPDAVLADEVDESASVTGSSAYYPPPPDAEAGDRWTNPVDGGEFVYIPGGIFVIGSESDEASAREAPIHEVEIDGYWMQVSETTNAQYRLCVEAGACTEPDNDTWDDDAYAEHPVANVDWEQATAYATWSSARLPTEAEWEAACRGDESNTYPWGEDEPTEELSNFGLSHEETAPVGSYPDGATPSGVFDLAGNVWEWTSSVDALYPYVTEDGREAIDDDGKRIMRGGSFYYDSLLLRCSARTGAKAGTSIPHLGFRTVVDASDDEWTSPADGGVYVYIAGGEYTIGSEADEATQREGPQHTVGIDGFWIQITETTNAQYADCVADGACNEPDNDTWDDEAFAAHPVANVSWYDALAYAEWTGARIPTEAEWEAACSGADNSAYPWGNLAPSDALSNFGEANADTVPVGSYPDGASASGVLDLSGNVWEWTSSTNDDYPYDASDGREALDNDGRRIMRGGSFYYDAVFLRCSARTGVNPTTQIPHLGFRTVRPAQ